MKIFNGYKFRSIISIVAKFLEAVFELMIPLFMGRLIDVGISNQDISVIYTSVFWMVVLTFVGYGFALICQYNASVVSQAVGGRLRSSLFKHQVALSVSDVDNFSATTLTNRVMMDTVFVQDMVARVIRLGVRAPLLIIGTLGALMLINKDLAIILLIAVPIFSLVISFFMYMSMRAHTKVNTNIDKISGTISDILSGSRIIRAFSMQNKTDAVFKQENRELMDSQHKVGIYSTLASPFTSLLMNLLLILLVYVSGVNISIGTMTQGQTLAVINYCSQLLLTLIVTMNFIMLLARGITSWKRINQVLAVAPEDSKNHDFNDEDFNLELRNLTFAYPNEKRLVLDNINFSLKSGQVLGVIGLTGSGKSSLLKILPRLLIESSGEVILNGNNINDYSKESIRDVIAYIPQKAQFIRGTLADNVSMKTKIDSKAALLDAQGEDILSKGLDFLIEESAKNLSGGQKQRVNIARALAKNPKLLLIDDSFSALDALTSKNLQKVLKDKYADLAQIIASQRTASIAHADQIIVLDNGKINAIGNHESLLATNEIYQSIYRLETMGGQNNA
ncbi:MAG: ABC transporter ATP-binding protein [Erysipelothrix sp.]|nr:ABC transporter ATP-binding protein [Erysipelothrix sp.]